MVFGSGRSGAVCADSTECGGEGLFRRLCGCADRLLSDLLCSHAAGKYSGDQTDAWIYREAFYEYLSRAHVLLSDPLPGVCIWVPICGADICSSGAIESGVCSGVGWFKEPWEQGNEAV